ncbi:bifunctional Translation initiation factor [Babesia duncani]|uniref:Bifunctional Translation initiation factor n=1 Tax=Babesia duncani TaxID=323732 RepID=A0AAD9UQU2_9APIC|nr:bifunctional Translation initiation factor [Babesia duncani]
MHWQSRGDFFCLRTTISKKTGKKGRKQFNQLEIFRVRERNIPVDTIQIEETSSVKQLHWEEGNSKRFALIVKDEETCTHAIRFYRVSDVGAKTDTVWITTFDINAQLNHLQWSPCGNYFILACLGAEGTLFFCTLNDQDKVEVLYKDEHFMMNSVRWSSCGRYLATCVNVPMPSLQDIADSDTFRYSAEAGYCLWSFQGRLLYKKKCENFYSFDFRPHPASLLKPNEIEAIRRNLKEYTRRFDALDEQAKEEARRQYMEKRHVKEQEFMQHLYKLLAWFKSLPRYADFEQGWQDYYNPSNWDSHIQVFEEVLHVKEQVLE